MTRSIIRRLAGGVAASALAVTTLGVVGAATPAQAATCTTTVTLTSSSNSNVYGGYNSLSASTSSTCGTPYNGSTTIQRWTGSGWATVANQSQGASYASYYGAGRFNTTTAYRAVYSGGAGGGNTWTPGASAARAIKVFRKVNIVDRSTRRASVGVFKIRPASTIKGKKAVFQVKRSGGWRIYKRVRVPGTGNIRVTFANSRKGIRYRMILPAARGMVKSVHGPFTARRY